MTFTEEGAYYWHVRSQQIERAVCRSMEGDVRRQQASCPARICSARGQLGMLRKLLASPFTAIVKVKA